MAVDRRCKDNQASHFFFTLVWIVFDPACFFCVLALFLQQHEESGDLRRRRAGVLGVQGNPLIHLRKC